MLFFIFRTKVFIIKHNARTSRFNFFIVTHFLLKYKKLWRQKKTISLKLKSFQKKMVISMPRIIDWDKFRILKKNQSNLRKFT